MVNDCVGAVKVPFSSIYFSPMLAWSERTASDGYSSHFPKSGYCYSHRCIPYITLYFSSLIEILIGLLEAPRRQLHSNVSDWQAKVFLR